MNVQCGQKHLQSDVLDLLRHLVGSANVVHQVLWRALPDGTPQHWAPPQLSQIQVTACHMPIHITPDQGATKLTRRRLFLSVLHPGCLAHLLQLRLSPPHVVNYDLCASSDNSGMETCDSGKSPMSTTFTS